MERVDDRPTLDVGLGASVTLLERLAFWSAIALPCLHLPALFVYGLDGSTAPVLVTLWVVHAVCLAVSARYDPSGRTE